METNVVGGENPSNLERQAEERAMDHESSRARPSAGGAAG
jgi:hypothetical protein